MARPGAGTVRDPCRSLLIGAVAAAFAVAPAGLDAAGSQRVAIVQPGRPGSPGAAEGFLRALSTHLESATGFEPVVSTYHNDPAVALAALRREPAGVGVVSLGFYLARKKDFGLEARLQAAPEERWILVAPPGAVPAIRELDGKKVAGGPLYEPEFLDRIVLPAANPRARVAGWGGIKGWRVEPTVETSRALYQLSRGKVDAVFLFERQYRALEAHGRLKNLEKVLESQYYAPALVVVFRGDGGNAAVTPEQEALVEAFGKMDRTPAASELLETMGCKGFQRIEASALGELEKKYHGEENDEEKEEKSRERK